ncbi:MAG: shikimate dehydrogenase [Brevefilum sp.]
MINSPLSLGLLGYPLDHSLSPLLHTTALRSLNIPGEYRLFPAQDENILQDYFQQMRRGLIHGLNITIPWKITAIQLLDQVSDTAMKIGAVNTVYIEKGQLIGENTDVQGFHEEIAEIFGSPDQISNNKALILGAGGAARASAWSLGKMGWEVTIAARRLAQAQELTQNYSSLHGKFLAIELAQNQLAEQSPNLIINATPVGMAPENEENPWPEELALPKDAVVFDLIYNPPETNLLATARANSHRAINGTGMLVSQAAAAFQLWTGIQPPRHIMAEELNNALSKIQRSSA